MAVRRLVKAFGLAVLLVSIGVHAEARDRERDGGGFKPVVMSARPANSIVSPTAPNYKIGPQDVLNIDVFQVPDLTKTIQVDSSGMILMPLIGPVKAQGRTTAELSNDLSTALANSYVKDPLVTVTVKESQSQRRAVGDTNEEISDGLRVG
jgi:protein involved in polysaccharide export with SLBB domain